ncbi:hypothetical protein V8E53_013102, partial [Lactarius tabidus]
SLVQSRPASNSHCQDYIKSVMVEARCLRIQSANFDVTKGTLLEYKLCPEQFVEVTTAIFNMDQVPSIIKSLFSWNWQSATLNHGDELVNLPLAFLQPYTICIPDFNHSNGQPVGMHQGIFGVLSMFWDTKTANADKNEPTYNFVVPHCDPLHCPVGALAIMLHFMFDQGGLVSKIPGWDWAKASSWHGVHLMFGRAVDKPMSGNGLSKMYKVFLDATSVSSTKTAHLARRAVPTIMEDMGVSADHIDAVGHWVGNVHCEVYGSKIPKPAVTALAGFYVGETYRVPWAEVPVPGPLMKRVFPFVEETVAALRAAGCQNQSTINFLELLQELQPFFWQVMAAIHAQFPESGIIRHMQVVHHLEAQQFFSQWPDVVRTADDICDADVQLSMTFHEAETQNAFLALSAHIKNMEAATSANQEHLSAISQCTEQFSPSKHQTKGQHLQATASTPHPSTCLIPHGSFPILTPPANPVQFPLPPNYLIPAASSASTSQVPIPGVPQLMHSQVSKPLTPYIVTCAKGQSVWVLPLIPQVPGKDQARSSRDLVLPPVEAFSALNTPLPPAYPQFHTHNCTWNSVLSLIQQPHLLWPSYAPKNLGEYPDIMSLWRAWEEGMLIEGVGCTPPLRLIDERWGSCLGQRARCTEVTMLLQARTIWAKFHFFIARINAHKAAGHTIDQTLAFFESERGVRSVNQFHKALQETRPQKQACYVSMARSARLERVLNDGYAVGSAPGVVSNWYAVCE